jgi:hypothetical protein
MAHLIECKCRHMKGDHFASTGQCGVVRCSCTKFEQRIEVKSISTSLTKTEVDLLREIAKSRRTTLAAITRAAIRWALHNGFDSRGVLR